MIEHDSCGASFQTVLSMVKVATTEGDSVHCKILGKDVIVLPGDNPHEVYRRYFPEMLSK